MKKIKVAIVAPVFGETGGPEVMVKNLATALYEKGVDVTLFAPADWKVKCKHIPTLKKSLWSMKNFGKMTQIMIKGYVEASQIKVLNYQKNFHVIHLNLQRHAYAVCSNVKVPCILTFHSPILAPEFEQIKSTGVYTVALSETHRKNQTTTAVIQNGISVSKIKYSIKQGKYLLVFGRITESKGIDTAIKIAKKSGKKLIILGRIGKSEKRKAYFREKIKPFLNKDIRFLGEASREKIFDYIKNAEAVLLPIRPVNKHILVCPLVIMESFACGTPVIGSLINPLPKPLKDSSVACISNNFNSWVKAARETDKFDRKKCREYAEKYFDSSIMADEYIKLYKKILSKKKA